MQCTFTYLMEIRNNKHLQQSCKLKKLLPHFFNNHITLLMMERIETKKIKLTHKDNSIAFCSDIVYLIAQYSNPKDTLSLAAVKKDIYETIVTDQRILELFFTKRKIRIPDNWISPDYFNFIKTLHLKSGKLTSVVQNNLQGLITLSIGKRVEVETNLYSLQNLTELNIKNNNTVRFNHVNGLDRLMILKVVKCAQLDCSKIFCQNMTMLNAKGTKYLSQPFISLCLEYLDMSYVGGFGASAFKNLLKLTVLNISCSSVSYLSELRHLTNLKKLHARDLNLGSYPEQVLTLADSVKYVDISNNGSIISVSGRNIKFLDISHPKPPYLFQYNCLNHLRQLNTLVAVENEIIDGHIKELKCLTHLDLEQCPRVRGTFINELRDLKQLHCQQLRDYTINYSNLNNLEEFTIHSSDTLTSKHLYQWKLLKVLHVYYCENVDSSIFKYMPLLKDVDLNYIKVKDIDLTYLRSCEVLNIANAGPDFTGKTLCLLPMLKSFIWYDYSGRGLHFLDDFISRRHCYEGSELRHLIATLANQDILQ